MFFVRYMPGWRGGETLRCSTLPSSSRPRRCNRRTTRLAVVSTICCTRSSVRRGARTNVGGPPERFSKYLYLDVHKCIMVIAAGAGGGKVVPILVDGDRGQGIRGALGIGPKLAEDLPADEPRAVTQMVLDSQHLVPLGHALATREGSHLQLPAVEGNRQVGDERVLRLSRPG